MTTRFAIRGFAIQSFPRGGWSLPVSVFQIVLAQLLADGGSREAKPLGGLEAVSLDTPQDLIEQGRFDVAEQGRIKIHRTAQAAFRDPFRQPLPYRGRQMLFKVRR